MARIRSIKPEFPHSESVGRLSRDARLLFIELWTVCDDSGRTRGNSRMLASLLFPYDDDAPGLMDGWLDELEREGMVRRYQADCDSFVDIPKWLKHQKIDKPSPSRHPPFAECSPKPRESSSEDQGSRIKDQGKETPFAESGKISLSAAGVWQGITPERRTLWATAYPAVNLDAELASAAAWAMENPKNRKSNWGRFIANWLKRSQDRAPATGNGKQPPHAVTCEFRGDPFEPGREPCGMAGAKKGAHYGGRALCQHHEREITERPDGKTEMPDDVRKALSGLVRKVAA